MESYQHKPKKHNFKSASKILANTWEEIVLKNFPAVADYVENATKAPVHLNEKWISVHCRISQYLLEIVWCNHSKCCGDFQATWKNVFSSCILLAPVPVEQIPKGPAAPSVSDVKVTDCFVDLWKHVGIEQFIPNFGFSQMPYDLHCPNFKAKVKDRVCK